MRLFGHLSLAAALSTTLALGTACGHGRWTTRGGVGLMATGKDTTSSASGFVVGGGTISSSTVVVGPYGAYPVRGITVGPTGTTVYEGGPPYTPYGYGYGSPYGYGAYGGSTYGYGYAPYGYGSYTSCTGAVACGSSTDVTVEAWAY